MASNLPVEPQVAEEYQRAAAQDKRLEVPAVSRHGCRCALDRPVRRWGDPATFRLKQLEVTYEQRWLCPERSLGRDAAAFRIDAQPAA